MSRLFLSTMSLFTGKPTFENLRKGIEAALRQHKRKKKPATKARA